MNENSAQVAAAFECHRGEPHISVDAHLRRKQIALAESTEGTKLVYLDMWVWNRISDCVLKHKEDSEVQALHRRLVDAVESGRIVCPVSEAIFLELMKQSDALTRTAAAELIDTLSRGICLMAPDIRMNTEVAYFMHSDTTQQSLHPLDHLVWTSTPYVLGAAHPIDDRFPPAEQLVIQKSFIDHLWEMRLVDIVRTIDQGQWPSTLMNDTAQRLNVSNRAHQCELKSFRKVYADEAAGGADVFAPVALRVIADRFTKETGQPASGLSPEDTQQNERALRALMAAALVGDKARHILRSLHIQATCHAAVRWDRQRKLSGNDLFDFQHASAALGYCDAFLCDGPMEDLLTSNHTKLDREMGCFVTSSPKMLIRWLDGPGQ